METLVHILLPIITGYLLFSSLSKFVFFISCQNVQQTHPDAPVLYLGILDLCLVVVFILQHKVMSTHRFKKFMEFFGVTIAERLVHVAVTSLTLLVMMSLWEPITEVYVWYIDTRERFFLWLFFLLLHTAGWILMFLDALAMDPLEMIGFTQIYNYHMDLPPPISFLPKMLQRCYRSVRHPGPLLLVLLLWLHPQMTLDRLVIGYLFTFFLWCGFRMTGGQYRHVSKWLLDSREEIIYETRYRVPGRPHEVDSGCEVEFSD